MYYVLSTCLFLVIGYVYHCIYFWFLSILEYSFRFILVYTIFFYAYHGDRILLHSFVFFFFNQKPAYEMRISDWSSDVCSSDRSRPVAADPQAGTASTAQSPPLDPAIASAAATSRLIANTTTAAAPSAPPPAPATPPSTPQPVPQASGTIATGVPTRIAIGVPTPVTDPKPAPVAAADRKSTRL